MEINSREEFCLVSRSVRGARKIWVSTSPSRFCPSLRAEKEGEEERKSREKRMKSGEGEERVEEGNEKLSRGEEEKRSREGEERQSSVPLTEKEHKPF